MIEFFSASCKVKPFAPGNSGKKEETNNGRLVVKQHESPAGN